MLLPLLTAACLSVPGESIVMDGRFDDWLARPVTLMDAQDSAGGFVDVQEIRAAASGRHVFLQIDFGRDVNAQGLEGHVAILCDADGDEKSGIETAGMPGVDFVVDLTPPDAPNQAGKGMAVRSTTFTPHPADPASRPLTPYDVNLQFGPTHAGRRMEFRLDRGVRLPMTPALFADEAFSCKIVCHDPAGRLIDETAVFTQALPPLEPHASPADSAADPLGREPGADVRVVSWNIQRGALLNDPEPFIRALTAIKPDVLLLQELPEQTSAGEVERLLRQLPRQESHAWTVMIGAGGGDLRCAVASRWPMAGVEALDRIPFHNRNDRTVRAFGAVVSAPKGPLLAVSAHLKCCGRAGDESDEARKNEVRHIHHAVQSALGHGLWNALVVAGDFNLVGSRDPVEMMAAGLDVDASSLTIVEPYRLVPDSNATWADPAQPFAPGRLDYMLFSDASLACRRSFVFHTADIGARWLESHGLRRSDSEEASDHFPVVADLAWMPSPSR